MQQPSLLIATNESSRGFRAFDGSNRYFKKYTLYDLDCCFKEWPPLGLSEGRTTQPLISVPNDGYFVLEKEIDGCCPTCPTGRCVVVESVRWYGYVLPVGTIFPCPDLYYTATKVPQWIAPPNPLPQEYIFPLNKIKPFSMPQSPLNTATFKTFGPNPGCCNAMSDKVYIQLTEELQPQPQPQPVNRALIVKDGALLIR